MRTPDDNLHDDDSELYDRDSEEGQRAHKLKCAKQYLVEWQRLLEASKHYAPGQMLRITRMRVATSNWYKMSFDIHDVTVEQWQEHIQEQCARMSLAVAGNIDVLDYDDVESTVCDIQITEVTEELRQLDAIQKLQHELIEHIYRMKRPSDQQIHREYFVRTDTSYVRGEDDEDSHGIVFDRYADILVIADAIRAWMQDKGLPLDHPVLGSRVLHDLAQERQEEEEDNEENDGEIDEVREEE